MTSSIASPPFAASFIPLAISNELNLGVVNIAMKQFTLILLVLIVFLMARIAGIANFRPSALRFSPLAPSIFVYLYFHIIGAALSIPYNVYQIYAFYWANNAAEQRSQFHFYMVYWTGLWQNTYNAISPLAVLFLTIERCIALRLPGGLSRKELLEKWLLRLSALFIGASFLGSTAFYLAELPLNLPLLTRFGCETVSCQMLRYRNLPQLFFKAILSFANIGSCILFLYTLSSYGVGAKQIRNRSVIITICFEAIFNIVPTFVTLGFNFLGQAPVSNVISMTSALDACCCAVYFSLLFLPNRIFRGNATNRVNQDQRKNSKIIKIGNSPLSQTPPKKESVPTKRMAMPRRISSCGPPRQNNYMQGLEQSEGTSGNKK